MTEIYHGALLSSTLDPFYFKLYIWGLRTNWWWQSIQRLEDPGLRCFTESHKYLSQRGMWNGLRVYLQVDLLVCLKDWVWMSEAPNTLLTIVKICYRRCILGYFLVILQNKETVFSGHHAVEIENQYIHPSSDVVWHL